MSGKDIFQILKQHWLALLLGGAITIALILAFLPDPLPVDTAEIVRGPVEVTIEGEGKTRVRENYVISAPVTGRLLRIDRHPGDDVVANETIVAVIEPADPTMLDARTRAQMEARVEAAQARLDLAHANVERAEAELAFAERELERAEELAETGNISAQLLDLRRRDVRTRRAELATAQSELRLAGSELSEAEAALISPADRQNSGDCCVEVRSPVAGKLLRLLEESEAVVTAGTPLMEIGDLADMELVVDFLSNDAVKVETGDLAYVDHWGGDIPLLAEVNRVEPSGFTKVSALGIEEQRVNIILDLVDDRQVWQNLGDGFRVEVSVIVERAENVLLVPVAALFRQGDTWVVFREVDGRATIQPVELGLRANEFAEVISGLGEGDTVVTYPPEDLDTDMRIQARR